VSEVAGVLEFLTVFAKHDGPRANHDVGVARASLTTHCRRGANTGCRRGANTGSDSEQAECEAQSEEAEAESRTVVAAEL
jgi:hypothetical protein